MQNYLQKSLDCSPYAPAETVADWVEQWHWLASKQKTEFQTTTVQKIPQWQKAVETALSYNPKNTQNWKPTVSIITSVFQGDKYIQNFLEDITRQTIFPQCELILVNANSPGNEEPIIQKYLSKYPNIIYKKLNFDPGLYEVWNLTIRIARGKYITNANLDDRRAPHHIEKHVRTLENHPEIDLVCAPLKVTLQPNQTWEKHSVAATWFVGLPAYFGRQDLFERAEQTNAIKSRNMPHCMPVWRKQLHWQNGFFNEADYGSCADWEFWLRCASKGAQYFLLREPLGIFYRNPESYNRQHVEKDKIATQRIINEYCDGIDDAHPDTTPEIEKTTSPPNNFVPSELGAAYQKFNLNFAWQELPNTSSNNNHSSGWPYIIHCLHSLHSDGGILVDPCIENRFLPATQPSHPENQPQPHTEPWVGFARYPANLPPWFLSGKTPSEMFSTPAWQQSLPFCKGIFCFSQHHQQWLSQQLHVPVSRLLHPVEVPSQTFSLEKFTSNPDPKAIQIGGQGHKLHSIYYLPVSRLKKAILTGNHATINRLFEIEKKKLALNPNLDSVEIIKCISAERYNNLLDKNIVYIELYDSVANPTILECIVRNTPVLVNPLPSVKEYLGEDYPFYFESKEEAANKAENVRLIEKTYDYLASLPLKQKLTADYFLQSVLNSDVFRSI
jgi:glycosyltransferase involved in cell wall biosynthesis